MALAAALDALVHVADLFATVCTRFADFGPGTAIQRMVVAVAAHEVDAGSTCRDAVELQFDVRLLNVIAALGQTMVGQYVGTGHLAFFEVLKAFFHGCVCGSHSFSYF